MLVAAGFALAGTALFLRILRLVAMRSVLTVPLVGSTMKLLRRAADDLGKTIVLVLQDINFASCYSDYIVAMRDGAIIGHGTPDETMKCDVIRDVYDMNVTAQEMGGRSITFYYV